MSLDNFLLSMPKVELHVHLEGTFRPATLLSMAKKNRTDLPAEDEAGIRRWFRFKDFEHFLEIYVTCSRCLRDPEDFQLLALDFMAEQAVQNVLYSEVHFTISTHLANGVNGREVLEALDEAAREGERRHGVRMRLIPDIVRNLHPERADWTVEWALGGRDLGVIGLGLSGIEAGYENDPFREHFEVATKEGLHRVAHAGETAGPESIRSALEVCQAERIGHGVRAVDDPALMEELQSRRIPLEICPSSNLALGVVADLENHPLDRLRRRGVEVSLNTDDPPFFDTNLTKEYLNVHRALGYDATQLASLVLAGLRHSFLSQEQKKALEGEFRKQFRELGERYLDEAIEPSV